MIWPLRPRFGHGKTAGMSERNSEILVRLLMPAYRILRRIARRFYRSDQEISERDHRREFMRRAFKALAFNGITGDYAEFGSHGGTTFNLAHREIRRHKRQRMMWAFDSFQGLPEQDGTDDYHPGWKRGKMATSVDTFRALCRKNGIPATAYRTVPGYYDETIGDVAADAPDLPTDIALAYVDCDLYSSTKIVLSFLMPRIKQGSIIAFDDYFCISDRQLAGERRAMLEAFVNHPHFKLSPFVQYGWHGMSFIVEDRALVDAANGVSGITGI